MRTGHLILFGATLLVGALFFFMLVMPEQVGASTGGPPRVGAWRAWLESPGGELPFQMELGDDPHSPGNPNALLAVLRNGEERIDVRVTRWEDGALVFDLRHYDSEILARPDASGGRLSGEWIKRRGPDRWVRLPFHAVAGEAPRFPAPEGTPTAATAGADPAAPTASASVAGRWLARFERSEEPSIGIFGRAPDGVVTGTFATTTGDLRHLEGAQHGSRLALSCFDGAHAFLFHAELRADGTLAGDFWSSDDRHERWTATRDESAALPDAFAQTTWTDLDLGELSFPDVDGVPRALDDPEFAGRARILQVFGSWCPNCHDASRELVRLKERYGRRGLSIVGLAFEVSGDPQRDATQVKLYARRHGVTWPLLLAGPADKAQATERVKLLDRVRSFPTTIFLHGDGRVRAVHTGFSGPATGEDFTRQQQAFEAIIEELLAETPAAAATEPAGAGAASRPPR